jgi:hypothetical protein
MANKAKHHGRRGRGEHEHEHERGRDREHGGDDPRRHASIIARRWLGSPPPTAERYAKALRQWRALPGAVVSSAADVTGAVEPPSSPLGASPTPGGAKSEP